MLLTYLLLLASLVLQVSLLLLRYLLFMVFPSVVAPLLLASLMLHAAVAPTVVKIPSFNDVSISCGVPAVGVP